MHPSEGIKGSARVLGSVPLGVPRRENEFGAAIFSLPDLRVSQSARCMPWPEYGLLLISPLFAPVSIAALIGLCKFLLVSYGHSLALDCPFMNVNTYLVMHTLHKGDHSRIFFRRVILSEVGDGNKKNIFSPQAQSFICMKRGEDLPMEVCEDTEVRQTH